MKRFQLSVLIALSMALNLLASPAQAADLHLNLPVYRCQTTTVFKTEMKITVLQENRQHDSGPVPAAAVIPLSKQDASHDISNVFTGTLAEDNAFRSSGADIRLVIQFGKDSSHVKLEAKADSGTWIALVDSSAICQ